MNCLIVDDEPLAIQVLETHISNIPGLTVAGTASNAFEAINIMSDHTIDLILLDIQMPKLLGHEFLRTLRNPPHVIFTTAYKEYAIDAFELDVTDYLLKPVTLERLVKAINKIQKHSVEIKDQPPLLSSEGFICFRSDRKTIKVGYADILYIESMKDYIKIVRQNEKPFLAKQSMSSIENALPAHLFLRIHRSYIVAKDKITAYTNHDVEIAGLELPIGRLYSDRLEKIT